MIRLSHLTRTTLVAVSFGLSACVVPLGALNPTPPASPGAPAVAGQAASLSSTRTTVELALNEERLLGDILKDQAGNQPAAGAVLWQSTNPAVATVHPTTGQAKGVAPGVTVFVATLAASPAARTQFEVKVVDKFTVRQITIEPANPTLVIGEKAGLRAAVAMADGTISANVVWSSSDDTIATVNPTNGEVFALKEGRVTIEGTYALDTRFKGVANVTVLKEKGAQAPAPQPSTVVFGPGGTAPTGTTPVTGAGTGTPAGTPVGAAGVPGRIVYQASATTSVLQSVDFSDPLTGWACGQEALLKTTDGGATWQDVTPGELVGKSPRGVHFNGLAGVILAANSAYNTTDGGATWNATELNAAGGTLVRMHFQDRNVGHIVPDVNHAGTAYYYRTVDGGTTWSKVTVPGPRTIVDMIRVGNADILLGDSGIYVYDASLGGYDKRRDASAQITSTDGRSSMLATDGQAAWYYDNQLRRLYKSADSGATWTDPGPLKRADGSTFSPGEPADDLVVLPGGGMFLLAGNGLYSSADRGVTWAQQEGLAGNGLGYYDAHFLDAATGWLVGDQGKIARFSGR